MSTILLWQFDKYMKKHKIGAYNHRLYHEFKKAQARQREERER